MYSENPDAKQKSVLVLFQLGTSIFTVISASKTAEFTNVNLDYAACQNCVDVIYN